MSNHYDRYNGMDKLSTNLASLGTDCISRQQAIYAVRMVIGDNRSISVCDAIKKLPPIQPEIVRCKDCKHRYVDGDNVRYNACELNHNNVQSDDWFCADGERREVNHESN